MNKITKFLMLFVLCLIGMQGNAQNVTISPQNGSMICSLTQGSPTNQLGFQMGAFGTWRHEQLSLTMTGSNDKDLTDDGQLLNHANHFISGDKCTFSPADATRTPEKYICSAWGGTGYGTSRPGYITIALPKGYRFTSYTFHLSHDVQSFGQNTGSSTTFNITTNSAVTMTENTPNSGFSGNLNQVTLAANSAAVEEFKRKGDDMGNVLYFTTDAGAEGFYAITFRYVELTFTADADASIDVVPASSVTTGTSLLEVPFATGKVDLGKIEPGTYNQATRVSYHYSDVTDMSASMLLYEGDDSNMKLITSDDEENFDGTPGYVANKKNGSITTEGEYFKLSPGSSKTQEYFLETPVYATMSNGQKNPIQFRIVGANIEYNSGSGTTYDLFTISAVSSGVTYYIGNGYGRSTYATNWFMDEEGYVRIGNNPSRYLTIATESYYTYLTASTIDQAQKFKINGNYLQVDGGNYDGQYVSYGGQNYNTYYWRLRGNTSQSPVTITKTGSTVTLGALSDPGSGTLIVYGADGTTEVARETVNSTNSHDVIPLTGLNNDAIKFSVQGKIYVKLNVTLQALNPYIDQMTVVMNDLAKELRMTRTFTADDFSVGGGTFRFYLPTDCVNDDLTISFEDLYSKYGDTTYDHTDNVGQSDSRYNFVKSQHFMAFNKNASTDINETDNNIYYNEDEAASETLESERIAVTNAQGQIVGENVRTKVGVVGNTSYRFNNADILAATSGYLTEYPFTLANYANQKKPKKQNGAFVFEGNNLVYESSPGSFVVAEFKNSETSTSSVAQKTFYVFTTDETKYNIAPTTATQHRFYSFYAMTVEIVLDDYSPSVTFNKIYDQTCYGDNDATDPFYGVIVTVEDEDIDAPLASDLATYKAIKAKISAGGTNVPSNINQILYLDMSGLNGVYHTPSTNANEPNSFNDLKNLLATNALVFLPINSTERYDNFAYAKKGEIAGLFQAANNIVLTDKQPFYSPYDIQVDAANYAKYTRNLTYTGYDKDKLAMVILPFELTLRSSKHTNPAVDNLPEGQNSFWVRQMKAASTLVDNPSIVGHDYNGIAYFERVSGAKTIANMPYMVEVDEASVAGDASFVAIEKGALVKATTGMKSRTGSGENGAYSYDYLYTGTSASCSFADSQDGTGTVTLMPEGSYSGQKYDRADTEAIFYFADNEFLNLYKLSPALQYLYAYPFHPVYSYSGSYEAMSNINGLHITFEPFEVDAIRDVTKAFTPDLAVRSGKGFIEMTSDKNQTVNIRSLNGTSYSRVNMNPGDSKTVALPAGVYVVNNVKIIVK